MTAPTAPTPAAAVRPFVPGRGAPPKTVVMAGGRDGTSACKPVRSPSSCWGSTSSRGTVFLFVEDLTEAPPPQHWFEEFDSNRKGAHDALTPNICIFIFLTTPPRRGHLSRVTCSFWRHNQEFPHRRTFLLQGASRTYLMAHCHALDRGQGGERFDNVEPFIVGSPLRLGS